MMIDKLLKKAMKVTVHFALIANPLCLFRVFLHAKERKIIGLHYDRKYSNEIISVYESLKRHSAPVVLIYTYPCRFDQRFSRSDFIYRSHLPLLDVQLIVDDGGLRWPDTLTRIAIFHGFGSLGTGFSNEFIEDFDHVFMRLKHTKTQLMNGQLPRDFSDKKFYEVGNPILDGKIANIDNSFTPKDAVLYAPTYHTEISSIFDFFETIVAYCEKRSLKLYLKLHPYLLQKINKQKSGGYNWKAIIARKKRESTIDIVWVSSGSDNVAMRIVYDSVDCMLTDTSGIGYEFGLITGKPVVFLGERLKVPLNDNNTWAQRNEIYKEYPEVAFRNNKIGPKILDSQSFLDNMDQFYKDRQAYNAGLAELRRDFTWNIGSAGQVAADIIVSIREQGESGL